MKNLFFTTTVHLSAWPPKRVEEDPIELHTQQEAINKMHHFCHEIYNIPITWITSYGALMKYGSQLKEFCEKYGDEVGIMEYGIYSTDVIQDKAHIYQSWVEDLGMLRPGALAHKEDEVPGIQTWYAMNYDDQKKAITYLKKRFEEVLGTDVVTFASPFYNADTMKILKDLNFECLWGNCWDYFCEGMDHKGTLPHPYYKSTMDGISPASEGADNGLLSIPWGTSDICRGAITTRMNRRGPSWCTNPMEYANRGVGLDQFNYFEKAVDETLKNLSHNPFIYLPLQLEAVWMDEGPMQEGYIDQYPDYALRCTEVFYNQIEVCLAKGAKCLTQKGFARWHREEIGDTSEYIMYMEQTHPAGLRLNGMDGEADPALVIANKHGQYVFNKANGFNYTNRSLFSDKAIDVKEKLFETPMPRVQLQNNFSIRLYNGVQLSNEGAEYRIDGLDFSAYTDYPDYAGVIWSANIPEYVNENNIIAEGLREYRLLKGPDVLIFFADMKEGDNHFKFSSKEPDKYISIVSQGEVGSHYEIWIKNDGPEVELTQIRTNIGEDRQIGCFWWNSEMHRSVDKFDQCIYNQHTGEFCLRVCYPASLKLKTGYNRLTLELFNNIKNM